MLNFWPLILSLFLLFYFFLFLHDNTMAREPHSMSKCFKIQSYSAVTQRCQSVNSYTAFITTLIWPTLCNLYTISIPSQPQRKTLPHHILQATETKNCLASLWHYWRVFKNEGNTAKLQTRKDLCLHSLFTQYMPLLQNQKLFSYEVILTQCGLSLERR